MTEPIVFLNGEYMPFSQAKIPFHDLGVVSGVTFTEMMRTFNGVLFRAEDHLERLFRSLQTVEVEIPESPKVLLGYLKEVTQRNFALSGRGELGVVIFVTPGSHALYANATGPFSPTICVHSFVLPLAKYREYYRDGAHVVIPSTRHLPPQCVDATVKHRSRLHWHHAMSQARRIAPGSMPLLLDIQGNITETATANFMIVKDNALIVPRPENILHGISLQTVLEIAAQLKISVQRRDIRKEDVIGADEAWLTSTPFCIAPCTRIDSDNIANGQPGALWRKVLSVWSERVGKDIYTEIGKYDEAT